MTTWDETAEAERDYVTRAVLLDERDRVLRARAITERLDAPPEHKAVRLDVHDRRLAALDAALAKLAEPPLAQAVAEAVEEALADQAEGVAYECPIRGVLCAEHDFVHGGEAEELRSGVERLLKGPHEDVGELREDLERLLDDVDARDSLAWCAAKGNPPEPGSPDLPRAARIEVAADKDAVHPRPKNGPPR